MMKLALAAFALVATYGSAQAVEVAKHIDAPGQPAAVWAIAGEFCSIKDWHPAVADCKESEEGGATYRTLTLKDNGGTIKEKLLEKDDDGMSYSYAIVEGPLPVKNYKAKFGVEQDDRASDRTKITWEAEFEANGASDDDAAKVIRDIFNAGLKGIKQKMLPPEGENQDAPQ